MLNGWFTYEVVFIIINICICVVYILYDGYFCNLMFYVIYLIVVWMELLNKLERDICIFDYVYLLKLYIIN